MDYRTLQIATKTCDPKTKCWNFWQDYGKKFVDVLIFRANYNLSSPESYAWVENTNIPDFALTNDMLPNRNGLKPHYKRTTLFSTCLLLPIDLQELRKFNFVDISWPFHKNCSEKEVVFEVVMIGWPVGFQSGIHDHPIGGCLAKKMLKVLVY